MMKIKWTSKTLSNLARLYEFLSQKDKLAAARIVQALTKAPNILMNSPRIGEQLFEFAPREVRRIIVRNYEMRDEIQESTIYVLCGFGTLVKIDSRWFEPHLVNL